MFSRSRWSLSVAVVVLSTLVAACGDTEDTGSAVGSAGGDATSDADPNGSDDGSGASAPEGNDSLEWEFELETRDGWIYDGHAVSDVDFEFSKDVVDSPPGSARLTAERTGSFEVTLTSATPGRNAPDLPAPATSVTRAAVFPEGTETLADAGHMLVENLCRMSALTGATGDYGAVCNTEPAAEEYDLTVDLDEQELDAAIAAAESGPNFYFYSVLIGHGLQCEVYLYPDGSVHGNEDITDVCTIS